MKKIFSILSLLLVVLAAACRKDNGGNDDEGNVPDVQGYELWYQSTDGGLIVPSTIEGFGANYLGSVYIDGYGLMYFDGTVTTIPDSAFKDCSRLMAIGTTNNLTSIGSHAFDGCTNLSSISDLSGLLSVGDYAFYNCGSLTSLGGPTNILAKMGAYAFSRSAIEYLNMSPDGITDVSEGVFKDCKNLTKIPLSSYVDVIPKNFASGCESATFVKLPGNVKEIKDSAFFNCSGLLNFEFTDVDAPSIGKESLTFNSWSCMFRMNFEWLDAYKKAFPDYADRMLPTDLPDDKVLQWCDYIPDKMPLILMTIPGLHDAATWSVSKHDSDSYLKIIKDQEKDYDYAFNHGARAFDLRLGYNSTATSFENSCAFYHGSFGPACCLNTFKEDIEGHFPSKDEVKTSFLVLIAKDEDIGMKDDPDKRRKVFATFMSHLYAVYDKDMFIPYRPDLTYGDIKGKILLFVRTDYFKDKEACSEVPLNHFTGSEITPYLAGEKTHDAYPSLFQDLYTQKYPDWKIACIHDAMMQQRKTILTTLFVNGLNAVDDSYFPTGWTICPDVNKTIADNVNRGYYDDFVMGVVLQDFYWQDVLQMKTEEMTFNGEKCSRALIRHNFRQKVRDYDWRSLDPA